MPSSPTIQDLLGRTRRLKSELGQTSANPASAWSKQAKQALDELCNIEAILQDFPVVRTGLYMRTRGTISMQGDTQSAEYQGLVDALQALELDTQRMHSAITACYVLQYSSTGYAPAPPLQPATSTRLAGASSAHLPRHGPGVAAATERARTGSLAPLVRVNSHSWLSEHLHPPRGASVDESGPSTSHAVPATPPRPGRSPFDLDTQPLIDAFPIQPSESVSVHDDALQVGHVEAAIASIESACRVRIQSCMYATFVLGGIVWGGHPRDA